MLPLDSSRWLTLRASPGGNGEFAARLLRELRDGKEENWAELYEQTCHQFTLRGELAYAVVPHVVEIATHLPVHQQLWPLVIAGSVAACQMAFPSSSPPIPYDLTDDYAASAQVALQLATAALNVADWRRGEVAQLLGVVAALHGHCDLALHLLLHGGSDGDLSCPECGEYIRLRENRSTNHIH